MSAIPQQVLDRQKASVNTFVAAQAVVFSGFEKLVELNLKVVKATLDEVAQKSQQAAEVKDPQEAAAFATGLLQPGAERPWPTASTCTTSSPACKASWSS